MQGRAASCVHSWRDLLLVRDICVVAGILNLEVIDKAILVHF